jgi:general secretion pathway protein A
MYLEYYGLLKEPFHITPDPDFLYMSPSHREAFAALVYGVEQRKGFISMTGEVGAGKTTILRAFMKRVEGQAIRPVYLFNPALTFDELLTMTLRGLGATPEAGKSSAELLEQLNWLLIEEFRAGRNVVLIVDEAQNMPVDTIEKVRMLSNLETGSDKLLQIVLVGQPELEDKLNLHELRQLKQRLAVRSVVKPLGKGESAEYIKHRLHMAGCPRDEVFSTSALRAIVKHGNGSPRTINILCDNAMIAGFGSQQELISAAIVRAVVRDMHATSRVKQAPRWAWAGAIAAGGIVVGALATQLVGGGGDNSGGVMTVEAVANQPAIAAQAAPAPAADLAGAIGAGLAEKKEGRAEVAPAKAAEAAPAVEAPAPVEIAKAAPAAKPAAVAPAPAPVAEKAPDVPVVAEAPPAPKVAPAAPVKAPEMPTKEAAAPAPALVASATQPVPPKKQAPAPKKETPAPVAAPAAAPKLETPASAPAPVQVAKNEPVSASESPPAAPVIPAPVPDGAVEVKAAPKAAPAPQPESKQVKEPAPAPVAAAPVAEIAPPAPVVAAEAVKTALTAPETLDTRTVAHGDCLSRLVAEVYGRGEPALVRAVHRYNPQILNPDQILPGQTVVFPVASLVGADLLADNTAPKSGDAPAAGANP